MSGGMSRWRSLSQSPAASRTGRPAGRPISGRKQGPKNKGPEGPLHYTASVAALTGRALTIFRAGFALNIIGSPVKGFVPLRALVAGFLITRNLANPGT